MSAKVILFEVIYLISAAVVLKRFNFFVNTTKLMLISITLM